MTKGELTLAVSLAKNGTYNQVDIDIFDGYGLEGFEPVHCTLDAVARLINWQCVRFDGSFDSEELDTIARVGKRKFLIL
jgi:uncharacterized protein with von Willebrand factor type A (vWA) domain